MTGYVTSVFHPTAARDRQVLSRISGGEALRVKNRPLLSEFGGERCQGGVAELGVRTIGVVVVHPAGKNQARLADGEVA